MNDRTTGYAVILFLAVFIIAVFAYLLSHFCAPIYRNTIVFHPVNSMNFIKKQDPVRSGGIETGYVSNVFLRGDTTLVEIATKTPLDIRKDYKIYAEADGFMGDRYLKIYPGTPLSPPLPAESHLEGMFPLGPAEALAYTADLRDKIHDLINLTNNLRKSPDRGRKTDTRLSAFLKQIDHVSFSLKTLIVEIDLYFSKNSDSIKMALEKTDGIASQINASFPAAARSLEDFTFKTKKLLLAADSLVSSCHPFMARLEELDSSDFSVQISSLRDQIKHLNDFIVELKKYSIFIPAKL